MQLELGNTKKPRPETSEKYYKAKKLIASGMNILEACAKAGTSRATFRKFESEFDSAPIASELKKRGPKPKRYMDIPLRNEAEINENEKTFVIVCRASQIKDILGGLK